MNQKKKVKQVPSPSKAAMNALDAVRTVIPGMVMPAVKEYTRAVVHEGQAIAYQTHDIMLARLYNSILLIVGLLLVAGAVITFFEIRLNIPRELTLLGLGIVMIAGSLYIKGWIRERQYYSFDQKKR